MNGFKNLVISGAGAVLCASCSTTSIFPKSLSPDIQPIVSRKELLKDSNVATKKCLALSGGGIRAASVSYGFLQGLGADYVKDIDVISSVSGGGYTTYGILYQMHKNGLSIEEILSEESDDGAFNKDFGKDPFIEKKDIYKNSGLSLGLSMYLGLFRALWSRDLVLSGNASHIYANDIHDSFNGGGEGWGFVTEIPIQSINTYENKKFPYPIFVASGNEGTRAPTGVSNYTASDVFDISPLWIGSKKTQHWKVKDVFPLKTSGAYSIQLDDAVAASGGAIDTPSNSALGRKEVVPSYFKDIGIGLGFAVNLPGTEWTYVSDGGFINNLGVSSLIELGCEEIISVDMGEDQQLLFSDLIARNIDDGTQVFTVESIINDTNIGQPRESYQSTISCPTISKIAKIKHSYSDKLDTHVHYCEVARKNQKAQKLTVVKLGLVGSSIEDYAPEIRSFYDKSKGKMDYCTEDTAFSEMKCPFPHQSTSQQNFNTTEFEAYRLLGKHMATEYLKSSSENRDGYR